MFWSRKQQPKPAFDHLSPSPDDVPLAPRECFVSGINKVGRCGLHRQQVIARCRIGEAIYLVRERDNPHDSNAVLLVRADGTDIGHMPKADAAELAQRLDRGSPITATYAGSQPMRSPEGKALAAPILRLTLYKLRKPKPNGPGLAA